MLCEQAYEHHCIERLPAHARGLRDAAVYMVANSLVLQWALEIYGFREVSIKARALLRELLSGSQHTLINPLARV